MTNNIQVIKKLHKPTAKKLILQNRICTDLLRNHWLFPLASRVP